MKACIGDYIKFNQIGFNLTSEQITSKVVAIHLNDLNKDEVYETDSGDFVSENELDLDDVLLESEVEGA